MDQMEILMKKTIKAIQEQICSLFDDPDVQNDLWDSMSDAYINHDQGTGAPKKFKFAVPVKVSLGRKAMDVTVDAECSLTKKHKYESFGTSVTAEPELPLDNDK